MTVRMRSTAHIARCAGRSAIVIWLTGLSSAGKTTLGEAILSCLENLGHPVELLDGDVVRRRFANDLGFSRRERDENIRRIGFIAELLAKHGVIVVVSAISPYREARDEVRKRITDFIEIYINAPLAVCEQRDAKGLYRNARAGELPEFTGVGQVYEPPLKPEIE
jgi:adenylyl-sulfate kinase